MVDLVKNQQEEYDNELTSKLKHLGYLFPTNEHEVEYFEKHHAIEKAPQEYSSPMEILKKGRMYALSSNENINITGAAENLAHAARNGESIPNEILKRMKEDRDKAENGEK